MSIPPICSCITHWQDGEEHEALRFVVDLVDPECKAKHPKIDPAPEPKRF